MAIPFKLHDIRILSNHLFSPTFIKVLKGHVMSNWISFCHSFGDGGADGAAGGLWWWEAALLRALQRWRQYLWGTHRGGGGDVGEQQSKQPLDTQHILFLVFLLHRPPQLGLLLHPKRSQSIRLFIFGLSPKSFWFPPPAAARAEDPPAGEEEKHSCAQRRRGGARRGCCQCGLLQPVIDLTHHFLATRQEHFGSRVVFISEGQQAKRLFSEL